MVVKGPFRGVRLRSESYFSPIYNKLLGAYERELHGVFEEVIASSPSLVVDIGAAEGYYACGLAIRCRGTTQHFAFEADFRSRFVLRRNLELNHLKGEVMVLEDCSTAGLQLVVGREGEKSFVLCDVEGMEVELLDPDLVPGLLKATILVELHEFSVSGVGDFLKQRWSGSHSIQEIKSQGRSIHDLVGDAVPWWVKMLPKSTVMHFASERPIAQTWLYLKPRCL
jgi:hypothetical protein